MVRLVKISRCCRPECLGLTSLITTPNFTRTKKWTAKFRLRLKDFANKYLIFDNLLKASLTKTETKWNFGIRYPLYDNIERNFIILCFNPSCLNILFSFSLIPTGCSSSVIARLLAPLTDSTLVAKANFLPYGSPVVFLRPLISFIFFPGCMFCE